MLNYSLWFQPIWKILVKWESSLNEVKLKHIWNHHPKLKNCIITRAICASTSWLLQGFRQHLQDINVSSHWGSNEGTTRISMKSSKLTWGSRQIWLLQWFRSFCQDSMRITVSRNIWKILCPVLAMWVINNICHYISGWFGIKEKHTAQYSSIEFLKQTNSTSQSTVYHGMLFDRLNQASQVITLLVGN